MVWELGAGSCELSGRVDDDVVVLLSGWCTVKGKQWWGGQNVGCDRAGDRGGAAVADC